MSDRYARLRAALAAVPHVKWSASRSNVTIPESDDWAGTTVLIGGLDKSVSRPYARYIAVANPEAIHALLTDYDETERALILTGKVNKDLMNTMLKLTTERDKLREALSCIAGTKTHPGDEKAAVLLASVINLAFVALEQEAS